MSAYYSLEFAQGEDWPIRLLAKEADRRTPLDLTNATVRFAMGPLGGPPLVEIANPDGVTIIDTANGVALIDLTPVHQSGIASGLYHFTIRVTLESGLVTDQAYGPFTYRRTAFVAP